MTKKLTALAIVAVLSLGTAAQAHSLWGHYFDKRSGNMVVVKDKCLAGEDSAAHLKLIDYRDNGGTVVYGCYRRGY